MNTFFIKTFSKLYDAVPAPMAATRDAFAERLQSLRDTASLLYHRIMENMGYGRERLKDIVEKEALKKKNQQWPRKKKKKPRSNDKDQQQPKNNNRMAVMMMMSDMIRLQK